MGDSCDRLPVVMRINAAIRSFCLSWADHDLKGLGRGGWMVLSLCGNGDRGGIAGTLAGDLGS
jgi:hypothetical protein